MKKHKPDNSTEAAIDAAVAAITKKYGPGSFGRLNEPGAYPEIKRVLSTGIKSLDDAFGVGGLPLSKLIEIFGKPSCGKTTFAKHMAARAQLEGIVPVICDTEHSGVATFDVELGLKLGEAVGGQPQTMEEVFDYHEMVITKFEERQVPALFIWDSIPTAPLAAEMELGWDEEAKMAARARFFSQKLPKLMKTIKLNTVGILWINQIRSKIGAKPWEVQTFRPGGWALDHWAHMIVEFQAHGLLKHGEEPYGIKTRAKVVKSKIAPPWKEAELEVHWHPARLVEAGAKIERTPLKPRNQDA